MQGILNAFDFIISTIKSVWDFFMGIVDNTILLVKYITKALVLAGQCIADMPTWLQIFATVSVSIAVLYLILGREAGKSDG